MSQDYVKSDTQCFKSNFNMNFLEFENWTMNKNSNELDKADFLLIDERTWVQIRAQIRSVGHWTSQVQRFKEPIQKLVSF